MVSPTSLLSKPKESAIWESHNLFARFSELSSVLNHPALTRVPPMTSFPQTQWFLLADGSRKIWEKGAMVRGVEMLALKLDREWPDWAANSINVLGVILSDLFTDFYPWLENLPVNQSSLTTTIRFERHLFHQAQLRHTWDWWRHNHKSKPNACFRPSLTGGNEKVVIATHPVNSRTRRTYSWRGYYEVESKKARRKEAKVTQEDWVLVE